MKACHIASFTQNSGIGIYAKNLIRHMPEVHVFDWKYKSRISRMLGPITSLPAIIQAFRNYDLIHIQYHIGEYGPLFLPLLCFLKLFWKPKIVLTLHEIHEDYPMVVKFHNIFYRCADLLMVHSKRHKAALPQEMKVKVIFLGVKKVFDSRTKSDRFLVLIPGFINRWKGHDIALKALKGLDVNIEIMGKVMDPLFFDELLELAADDKRVKIKQGFFSDKVFEEAFRRADLILLPYRKITGSAILSEALAYHKPIIASDIPYFKEILPKEFLAQSEDVASFYDKISEAINNKETRDYMIEETKRLASQFSWENLAKITQKEYLALTSDRQDDK
jgi:glycosyltransferase involved in cell wall biosynthesis